MHYKSSLKSKHLLLNSKNVSLRRIMVFHAQEILWGWRETVQTRSSLRLVTRQAYSLRGLLGAQSHVCLANHAECEWLSFSGLYFYRYISFCTLSINYLLLASFMAVSNRIYGQEMRCPGVNRACLLHDPKPCSVTVIQDFRIWCRRMVLLSKLLSVFISLEQTSKYVVNISSWCS